jgi:hypothetical protein
MIGNCLENCEVGARNPTVLRGSCCLAVTRIGLCTRESRKIARMTRSTIAFPESPKKVGIQTNKVSSITSMLWGDKVKQGIED